MTAIAIFFGAVVLWWIVKALWSPVAASKQAAKHGGAHADRDTEKHEPGVVHLSAEKQKAAGLKLASVEKGSVTAEHWLTGQVSLDESRLAPITSRVTGTVRELEGQLGHEVKGDQVLALLDSIQVGNAKLELYEKTLERDAAKVYFDWNNTVYTNTQELIGAL